MTSRMVYHMLRHFDRAEFREHAPVMAESTLLTLDAFRHAWGAPVVVSPNPAALARYLGPESMSGHNVDRWEWCYAVDVFPTGMETAKDRTRALACALTSGATGVGLYLDTTPGQMIHIDTRPDRTPHHPRLWSRIGGKYGPIKDTL